MHEVVLDDGHDVATVCQLLRRVGRSRVNLPESDHGIGEHDHVDDGVEEGNQACSQVVNKLVDLGSDSKHRKRLGDDHWAPDGQLTVVVPLV